MSGRYATPRFGETMHAFGEFLASLPAGQVQATLVRNVTTGASLAIASANATEIPGSASGGFATYEWSTANLTTPITVFAELLVVLKDTVTLRVQKAKVVLGGFPDESALQRFDGRVHVDTVLGLPGTTYPRGTPESPVNNMADAFSIRSTFSLPKRFLIRSNGVAIVLDATVNAGIFADFIFEGVDPQNDILRFSTSAGAINTAGVRLGTIQAYGNFSGRMIAERCTIGNSTSPTTGLNGTFSDCSFQAAGGANTLATAAGAAVNIVNAGRAADVGVPDIGGGTTVDLGAGATTFLAERLVGFWRFNNVTGGDTIAAVGDGAQLHFATGSGAPIIALAGLGEIVNTVGFPPTALFDRMTHGRDTIRTRKQVDNRRRVDWAVTPAQEVSYEDDAVTELQRANLKDQFGADVSTSNRPSGPLISERVPV